MTMIKTNRSEVQSSWTDLKNLMKEAGVDLADKAVIALDRKVKQFIGASSSDQSEDVKHLVANLQHTKLVMSHDCVKGMKQLANAFRKVPKEGITQPEVFKTLAKFDEFVDTEFDEEPFNVKEVSGTTEKQLEWFATTERRVATKMLREYRRSIDLSKFDVESLASILDNAAKHLEVATNIHKGDIKQAKRLIADDDRKVMHPLVVSFVEGTA
jgi:hypothetical protein